ncbi:MAG: DUF881 domain-containing protein [Thermoanaerobacteraceae bacterium]
MKKSIYFSIAFVCIVLGIMLSTQFKTVQKSGEITVQRSEELTNQLKQVQSEKQALQKQLKDLENRINEYIETSSKTNALTQTLKSDIDKYKEIAGLTDVQGPGIIVTITDGKQSIQSGQNNNLNLVQDEDLLRVVNELRAAGAEALSLNDQRIITTTEIRNIGPTINVNSTRFVSPYVFKAIGDPDTLEAALKLRGGLVDQLSTWGIEVNIKKSDKILIKKYDGIINFKYAKPITEGENK